MKTTKTTKKEDENENNEEEERVSRIRFELCWWIQEEHCGGLFSNALIAKDKEILATAEKLTKKEQSHAEIEIKAEGIWSAINSSNEKAQWEANNNSRVSKDYKGKWNGE